MYERYTLEFLRVRGAGDGSPLVFEPYDAAAAQRVAGADGSPSAAWRRAGGLVGRLGRIERPDPQPDPQPQRRDDPTDRGHQQADRVDQQGERERRVAIDPEARHDRHGRQLERPEVARTGRHDHRQRHARGRRSAAWATVSSMPSA